MRYLLFLPIFFLLSGCNASQEGDSGSSFEAGAESPNITIEMTGAEPGGMAFLIGFLADQQFKVDSARIGEGGILHFQRETPYDPGMLYTYFPDRSTLQLLIDKDQTFTLKTNRSSPVENMEVEGSLENELLYRNLKFELDYNQRLRSVQQRIGMLEPGSAESQELKDREAALIEERKAHIREITGKYPETLFAKFKTAGQNPEPRDVRLPDGSIDKKRQVFLYRRDFWENVDFSDQRLLRTPVIHNKLQRYIKEMTVQHADSIISATRFLVDQVLDKPEYYQFFTNWVALQYQPGQSTLMDAEAILVHMVQNYFTYDRCFWADSAQVYAMQLRAQEMAASLLGKKGPDVQAKDPAGQMRSIYEIESPYIIVFMYNPECDHCIEETPKLLRFYREWKAKGVEVYAIGIDTDDTSWRNFIETNQMNWINVFDPTNKAFYGKYYVDNTPEVYVLNPDRTIIGKNLNVDQIETVIEGDTARGN